METAYNETEGIMKIIRYTHILHYNWLSFSCYDLQEIKKLLFIRYFDYPGSCLIIKVFMFDLMETRITVTQTKNFAIETVLTLLLKN